MKPLNWLRTGLGFVLSVGGVIPQVVKHENCAWIGLEVLVAAGLGILGVELGLRVRRLAL